MKNVEKKELLKLLDFIIESDVEENLLRLIENEIVDKRMCQSQHEEVRKELARNGHFIDILIEDKYVKNKVYEWLVKNNKLEQNHIDYAIQQDDYDILLLLIKNKIVDERMYQSQHWQVRRELAENGYFIDVLINDKDEDIRYKTYRWLIENNKLEQQHIDYAIQQDDYYVLNKLIENKILDKRMCQSKWSYVREELAKNGYFVDILINDNDRRIRGTVYEWLVDNNKITQQHINKLLFSKDYKILQFLINLNNKNELINKEKLSKKIKEIQEERENNLSLLIHNKNILK